MSRIVVIGSINMDLVVTTDRFPKAGETVKGVSFNTFAGGKGANQAVAASRMGAEVWMVGAIGNDSFGPALKKALVDSGVNVTQIIQKKNIATGTATIIVEHTGDNRIIIVPGANGLLFPGELASAKKLVTEAELLVLQFEIPMKTVEYAIYLAHKNSVPIILNPAPAYPVPDHLLGKVNYLIANEVEAEMLSGIDVSNVESGYRAAEILLDKGVEIVIITLGKQGALFVKNDQRFQVIAPAVDVVDTTAAGDTFVGAFAVACTQKMGYPEAMKFAVYAGTLAVTRMGAQPSIPTSNDVFAFMARTENVV